GGVSRCEGGGKDRHHRADVDHLAAAAPLHFRIGGVRADEGTCEVAVHHLVPFGDSIVLWLLANVDARIVDENVETTEQLDSACNQLAARGFVEHVDGNRLGTA